jgi:hypothetical protein
MCNWIVLPEMIFGTFFFSESGCITRRDAEPDCLALMVSFLSQNLKSSDKIQPHFRDMGTEIMTFGSSSV